MKFHTEIFPASSLGEPLPEGYNFLLQVIYGASGQDWAFRTMEDAKDAAKYWHKLTDLSKKGDTLFGSYITSLATHRTSVKWPTSTTFFRGGVEVRNDPDRWTALQ